MILLEDFRQECLKDNIPIILQDALSYIIDLVNENNINYILEIGSAYGYSSIMIANNTKSNILTIEKDEFRFTKAIQNIEKYNMQKRVNILLKDAGKIDLSGEFDLVFLDGPKAQYEKHFLKFSQNLKENGYFIIDNMFFHNLDLDKVSRQTRQLIKKINKFKDFILNNQDFDCQILNIGDGLCVCKKKSDIL